MPDVIIGIGGLAATRAPDATLKTLGLGSCVALILLDPATRAVGMVHIALPDSAIASRREDVDRLPGRFADTAIPCLLREMGRLGMVREKGLIVKLIGGASVMDVNQTFNIGKRNVLAIKKILWERGMGARNEDIGGTFSRSVAVPVATGIVTVYSPGRGEWKL